MRKKRSAVYCQRCKGRLTQVCSTWRVGEIKQTECQVCGQWHELARSATGMVYVSAGITQPLQPRLL